MNRLFFEFFFLGFIISCTFIALTISFFSKDKKFLHYIIPVFCFSVYCLNNDGLFYKFFWVNTSFYPMVLKINQIFLLIPPVLLGNKQLQFNKKNVHIKAVQKLIFYSPFMCILVFIFFIIFAIMPSSQISNVISVLSVLLAYSYIFFQFLITFFYSKEISRKYILIVLFSIGIIPLQQIVRLFVLSYSKNFSSEVIHLQNDCNAPEFIVVFLLCYHFFWFYLKTLEIKISKNNVLISKIEDDKSKIEKNRLVQKEFIEKIYSYIHIIQNQIYSAENMGASQKNLLLENFKKLNSMFFVMNLTSVAEFNPKSLQIQYEKIDLRNFLNYIIIPEINELSMINTFPEFKNSVKENIIVEAYSESLFALIKLTFESIRKINLSNSRVVIKTDFQFNILSMIIEFSGEEINYEKIDTVFSLDFIDSEKKYLKNPEMLKILQKWGMIPYSVKTLVDFLQGSISVLPFKNRLTLSIKISLNQVDSEEFLFPVEIPYTANFEFKKPLFSEIIYLINSEHDERIELYSFLKPYYRIFSFNSFSEVFENENLKKPDFIICSERVGNDFAVNFIKKLKASADFKSIPVIVLSTDSSDYKIKSILKSGAVDVMTVPYNQGILLYKINSIFDSRKNLIIKFMKKLSLLIENLENFSDVNLNFSDSAALRNEIFPEEPEEIEKIPKDSESGSKEDFSELKARFDSANLTKTEIKIAEKIALGKSDKEIAKELQISPSTVAVHNKKIFKKLNIHSRKELSQ
ncbi:MAG: LuxR C-terminal-related transcriptional regulator [Spirochaetia bacterium]|nr:LuxR C-terminal-related transcriptional regulator [Spirochaetia bacterium]